MPIMRDLIAGDDLEARLKELLQQAERGEFECLALRVYRTDGSVEDFAVGGTAEQKDEALRELKDFYAKAN